jgi:hypothetical protein
VQRCFDQLAADFDPSFSEYRTRNLSFELVRLLNWRTFDDFRNDMLLLA